MPFTLPDVYYKEVDESAVLVEPGIAKFGGFVTSTRGHVGLSEEDSGLKRITSAQQFIEEYGRPKKIEELAIVDVLRAGRVTGVTPNVQVKRVLSRDTNGDIEARWGGIEYINGELVPLSEGEVYPYDNYSPTADVTFGLFARQPSDDNSNIAIAIDTDTYLADSFIIEVHVRDNPSDDFAEAESFEVSLSDLQSPSGEQLEIEDKINNRSDYILAVNNPEASYTNIVDIGNPVALGGGDSGQAPTVDDVVTDIQVFRDPELADVRGLLNCGWAAVSDPLVSNEIIDIAESRLDMVAIVDPPRGVDADTLVNTWKENLIIPGYVKNTGSYACTFAPSLIRNEVSTGKTVEVPTSGQYAQRATITFEQDNPWTPVFGVTTGQLSVSDLSQEFGRADMQLLYQNRINTIRDLAADGITIMGNKTLQPYFSKTSQIHVRWLLITIEIAISRFAQRYIGRLHTEETRSDLRERITRYLRTVAGRDGFDTQDSEGFYVKMDEENNPPEVRQEQKLVGDIFVIPVDAIETIQLNFRIMESGVVEFEEYL